MLCPRCGQDNEDDSRFCANCGNRFEQNAPLTRPPPAAPDESMATQIVPRPQRTTEPPPLTSSPRQEPVPPPPKARRPLNPAFAAALAFGGGALGVVLGVVLFASADEGGSSDQRQATGDPTIVATSAPPTPAPAVTTAPLPTQAPVSGPGYKMTAIFTEPPNMTTPVPFDRRIFDAIIVGVNWDDAARLYGRRYPITFLWNITTTNLLIQRHSPDDAKRLLVNAGYPTSGPKFYLAFNPGDRVFATWLTEQLRALGLIVVTDANQFTAEEKQQGYYGLIIDVIPA